MKKIFGKVNEKGTLLVEAMAMLGLIAMVTPVLYKKAAERTVELQDVNASSQLRALSSAVDSYIKDNFAKITKGDTINGIDYGSFAGADDGTVGPIPLSAFADYLPYGFLNEDGSSRETKLFTDNYNVWIKLEADYKVDADGNRKALSQILTGFVSAIPKNADEIGQVRASRIASMIGSNGGYVIDGNTVMGAQGIWSVPVNEFNGGNFSENTFVVSSLQPISSQGLANEDVLHRKDEPDADQELNTMETDLFLGFTEQTSRNIRMVNQIIMNPDPERMVGSGNESAHNAPDNMQPLAGNDATDLDKALYITKGGGAYLEGALNAMNSLFSVNSQGIRYFGTQETEDGINPDGSPNTVTSRAAEPVMKIDSTSLVYGNPGNGNTKLTVNAAGSMVFGANEVTAEDGTVTEAASESLYADKKNFRAGDSTLRISKEDTDGGEQWVSVFNKGDAHTGSRTQYTWTTTGPVEGATIDEETYEVSINGSAFVRDTLLVGKIKSYNVDAAVLRAGVDPQEFEDARWDTDFYTVTRKGSFVVGTSDTPVMTISEEDYGDDDGRDIRKGVVIHTTDDAAVDGVAGGIDIRAGHTGVLSVNADGSSGHYDDNPQNMSVRIGGEYGVYLTAFNDDGDLNASPVSIQGDMFRAYGTNQHGIPQAIGAPADYKTIMTNTHFFNIFSPFVNEDNMPGELYSYVRGDRNASGDYNKVHISDSNVIISSIDDSRPLVDIVPAAASLSPTSKFVGGIALYDYDYNLAGRDANGISNNKDNYDDASFLVRKGAVEIRTTVDSDENKNLTHGEKILVVDNNKNTTATQGVADTDAGKGSVYIRKGSMNLATYGDGEIGGSKVRLTNTNILDQYAGDAAKKEKAAVGYIAADRFVSQFKVNDLNILSATKKGTQNVAGAITDDERYGNFEVNPAYTSVMHDIKLTTRGGARLSDILPDFINKGIYIVDTTYSPFVPWVPGTNVIPTDEVGDSAENEVSAFAGFIPTPKCPPGYAKVVTLTPSGWAMAQAGTPVKNGGTIDIMTHNNPQEFLDLDPMTGDTVQPLTFQKNTWLKAMVLPYCNNRFQEDGTGCGENFRGWGAILGFIYPHSYYKEFITQASLTNKQNDNDVYWNLFPVYYKQLEGYATVYCYFDRQNYNEHGMTTDFYNENYVDKSYDQLKDYLKSPDYASGVQYYEKKGSGGTYGRPNNTSYINRLNDPNLKYKDPW